MSDYLFGLGSPVIEGTGTPDSNKQVLLYSVISDGFNDEPDILTYKAPLDSTGTKTFIPKGIYSNFTIVQNLYKYGTSARATLLTFLQYLHQKVYFYPFIDKDVANDGLGEAIKDSAGNKVLFFVKNIKPVLVDATINKYKLIWDLQAVNYTDIKKLLD